MGGAIAEPQLSGDSRRALSVRVQSASTALMGFGRQQSGSLSALLPAPRLVLLATTSTAMSRRSTPPSTPGKIRFIREIDHAIRQVLRPQDAVTSNQLTEPFAVISMDVAGNISTFSPELLGPKNADYGDFLLGNINTDRLVDLLAHPNLARMQRDIGAGVELCRQHCQYFSVCGGGEPVNKLSENGSFVTTATTHCRLTRMRMTDLVLDAIDRLPAWGAAVTDLAGHAHGPVEADRIGM